MSSDQNSEQRRQEQQEQRDTARRLREEIPLEAVFEYFGCTRDEKDPKHNWRTSARDRITVTDGKFYNHDQKIGGFGSIDLTMHLGGSNFKEAIATLADIGGQSATVAQYRREAETHVKRIVETTKAPDYKNDIPKPYPRHLPRVIKYLHEERGIPRAIIEKSIENGRLWADNFGNAVFSLRDPELTGKQVGAEVRGTIPEKPFHGVRGPDKGFFFTGDAKSMVAVFVEAGIDALSYESIDRNALVVSTTGSRKESLQQVAEALHKRGYKIVAGFDTDKTGDRLTEALKEKFGDSLERRRPDPKALAHFEKIKGKPGKDWNDMAVALADLAKEAEKQKVVAKPGKEQEQTR